MLQAACNKNIVEQKDIKCNIILDAAVGFGNSL
jgi:hypothetical protein